MSIKKVIARSWTGPGCRARLLSARLRALAELGTDILDGATVKVVQDTADDARALI